MKAFFTEEDLNDLGIEPYSLFAPYSFKEFKEAVKKEGLLNSYSDPEDGFYDFFPLLGATPFPEQVLVMEMQTKDALDFFETHFNSKTKFILAIPSEQFYEIPEDETAAQRFVNFGCVGYVINIEDSSVGSRVKILCGERVEVLNNTVKDDNGKFTGRIVPAPSNNPTGNNVSMLHSVMGVIKEKFLTLIRLIPNANTTLVSDKLREMNDIEALNFICFNAPLNPEVKYSLLENEYELRAEVLNESLDEAFETVRLHISLKEKTAADISQSNRENFLRNQLQLIKEELGEGVDDMADVDELRKRADVKIWTEAVENHFRKELRKLERYNVTMPEYSIQYNYLDMFLNLPWDHVNEADVSLQEVRETLDEDHYGLEKIKERIVEHTAVNKLRGDMKSPILCLYGPPGVGKTSLGKSIARALGRDYHRIALGGVSDEAEIRGHRRTYVGAMAGRIMAALAKAKENNPVIVLDEIDKIGKGLRGDPAQALLEVLDPEQNSAFHDNFVDFDYDLSKVFFIATANSLSTISEPLLDRMEAIELSGYTTEEKIEIAIRHLVPKGLEKNGLKDSDVSFERGAILKLIDNYTRESGVRQLEKKISSVLRKIACKKVEGTEYSSVITATHIPELLGKEEVYRETYDDNSYAGVVTGLAWTAAGGEILFIETSVSKGKGDKLTLTGNLGDVMKESATIALEYLRSHAETLGLGNDLFKEKDIHIHVPEGAVPKDGPSAGITMVTSLASALTGRKVKDKLAMTGEITLRGKVLPVGGIKEKILAAKRAGITEIILCKQNKKDVDEIPPQYLDGLNFKFVENASEVLAYALLEERAEH